MTGKGRGAEGQKGFAGRWSRMKQAAKAMPEAEKPADPAAEARAGAPAEDGRSEAEILAELGLPDPEDLKSGDDFSGFMARAVPAQIRNRALRRLWRSNPLLSAVDGLVDYGEDFTDASKVIGNLQTAYQVGRGWVDRLDQAAEAEPPSERERAPAASVEGPEVGAPEPQPATEEHPDAPIGATPAPAAAREGGTMPEAGDDARRAPPGARRRMRFRLAEE